MFESLETLDDVELIDNDDAHGDEGEPEHLSAASYEASLNSACESPQKNATSFEFRTVEPIGEDESDS